MARQLALNYFCYYQSEYKLANSTLPYCKSKIYYMYMLLIK